MATVAEHYDSHLAGCYAWLYGGMKENLNRNRDFFNRLQLEPETDAKALDLGCGPGFQSIPLAELGYQVTAIDLSEALLTELNRHKGTLSIQTVHDNLLRFEQYCTRADVVVCMGDTLTHLISLNQVDGLLGKVYHLLSEKGRLIVSFRDLTNELKDGDRFIPVRQHENRIVTCFLEYEAQRVKVHDLIYEKQETGWDLRTSAYYKIKIPVDWVQHMLLSYDFKIQQIEEEKGMITIIAGK